MNDRNLSAQIDISGEPDILTPRKALNKAWLKVKPERSGIEEFKANLTRLLDHSKTDESEEFHKNNLSAFLKNTWYSPDHYINTKESNDLVIHNGKTASSAVGVIIETKKPGNRAEMIRKDHLNTKALQELLLYYLRERITGKNLEIKYLVVTNIYEWFIFDATIFEKEFAGDRALVKKFEDFQGKRLSGDKTEFFYSQIAAPAIDATLPGLSFTHFDIRDYEEPLRNDSKADDNKLIALFKLLSPQHLLKLPFINDSNSLDRSFYTELLHIIGLTEIKQKGKKLIERKKEGERDSGSLIENAIVQLQALDKITRLESPHQYGETREERLFNVALELVITWINRILFLKLLEAQQITYHKGDREWAFLNSDKIHNFTDLNSLFFSVLACKPAERNEYVKADFAKVPYLNSSLFEASDLEHNTIIISNLRDERKLPLLPATVLKEQSGKRRTGEMTSLEYLFEFLNAYDFSSEGSEVIQEDNKRLINASVLGLIFEKINGYKDGSFFTPGFITMYMCRETIRRAVIEKFKTFQGFRSPEKLDMDDIYNAIGTKITMQEANFVINSLKICDPAVGSGHFLVSALNEIIAIKSDLGILTDRSGNRKLRVHVEVVNDELIVTDEEGYLFEYKPNNPESRRIQEALFHEKQTLIENCLFGVDINFNSVKICRLRLWIELLKNAYYRDGGGNGSPYGELETLPNIDINIKCGNSLISRFALDSDLKSALKKSKWNIESYRLAVQTYRNAHNKDEKWEMKQLITDIKSDFRTEIAANDPKVKRLNKLSGELYNLLNQQQMFEPDKKEKKVRKKKQGKLEMEINKLSAEIEKIKSNRIYERAFEWRFEFPEVLSDEGEFMGFDVVIGNPPYIDIKALPDDVVGYLTTSLETINNRINVFAAFFEIALKLCRNESFGLTLIIPTAIATQKSYKSIRKLITKNSSINTFVRLPNETFGESAGEVKVDTAIVIINEFQIDNYSEIIAYSGYERVTEISSSNASVYGFKKQDRWAKNEDYFWSINTTEIEDNILHKCYIDSTPLEELTKISLGITPYDKYKGHTQEQIINKVFHCNYQKDNTFKKLLAGNDIQRYHIKWNGEKWISYGEWLGAPRKQEFFTKKRILVKQIIDWSSKRIWAVLTNEELYNTQNAFNIISNSEYELEYILGILNSKLMILYHRKKFLDEFKMRFQKVLIKDCRQFPIKNIPQDSDNHVRIYDNIVSKVKNIQELKRKYRGTDTEILESGIDQLVYELYGLSEDEIGVVEGV